MATGYVASNPLFTGSNIINGQLVPQASSQNYWPLAQGPVYQGVPASPLQTTGTSSGGSYGGTTDASSEAGAAPWSPSASPVPWMIGMFVLGFVLLRYVHWGY